MDDKTQLEKITFRPRFPLGLTVITPSVQSVVDPLDVGLALTRHQRGDWGELHPCDQARNERALSDGSFVLSRYSTARGYELCIATEGDRSVTRVLLPDEYTMAKEGEARQDFASTYSPSVTKRNVHEFHV